MAEFTLDVADDARFIAAALCGIVSHTMMNLLTTSAPLAMNWRLLALDAVARRRVIA